MHYLKPLVIWVILGTLVVVGSFMHVSTVAHVDTHGIAVYPHALSSVVAEQDTPKLIQSLNINQPTPADRVPIVHWKQPIETLAGLEMRLQSDGRIRLTGLSYQQLQAAGVQLPIFAIQ